jgi:hypothetical protein
MKIKEFKLSHLRNDEHFQFMQFVLALVKEIGAAALRVEPQNAALAAAHRQEDEALKKIMKSALTAQIDEADRARDGVFRGMAGAVRSAQDHFKADIRAAAVRLGIVMDTYGNVAARSHVEATSAVYNLLVELTTRHVADTEALDLGGWITELDRLNREVEKLLEGRADEGAERSSLVLKTVRAEVDDAYRALAAMAEAQAMVASAGGDQSATAVMAGFIRRLGERIDMVNDALAIRRGMARAAKEKEKAKEEEAKGRL